MIREIIQFGDPHSGSILTSKARKIEPDEDINAAMLEDLWDTCQAMHGAGLAAPQIGISKAIAVVDISIIPPSEMLIPNLIEVYNNGDNTLDTKYWSIMNLETKRLLLINPEIVTASKDKIVSEEGCLSIAGIIENVERPSKVKVKAINQLHETVEFEVTGLAARIFCHEIDHLNGILYPMKLGQVKRDIFNRRLKKMRG